MSKVDNVISQEEAQGLERIENLDQFATAILNWHVDKTNQLRHVLYMPEGADSAGNKVRIKVRKVTDSTDESEDAYRIVQDSEVEAFKMGAQYALDLFRKLPFDFVPTDADGNIRPEYQSGNDNSEQTT